MGKEEDDGEQDAPARHEKYRAPALEKGLDILELVTRSPEPLTIGLITQQLGRSTGELFRMIQVLEHRGYIEQREAGRFTATTKLFALGMAQAPIKSMIEVAIPIMRRLALQSEQSCHLATVYGGDIVVLARMESASLIGFSVRLGYRAPIVATASGAVLYAFQSPDVRARWEKSFGPSVKASDLKRFRAHADEVARQGYDQQASGFVSGIIDLSAPLIRGDVAAAALTMPFVIRKQLRVDVNEALEMVRNAAADISSELAGTDVRVQ